MRAVFEVPSSSMELTDVSEKPVAVASRPTLPKVFARKKIEEKGLAGKNVHETVDGTAEASTKALADVELRKASKGSQQSTHE